MFDNLNNTIHRHKGIPFYSMKYKTQNVRATSLIFLLIGSNSL